MLKFIEAINIGLIKVLPLANPITTVAIFLSLSKNMTFKEKKYQSILVALYSFLIMFVIFYTGKIIMSIFGISIIGLRISGGLIISFIGFNMLFKNTNKNYMKNNIKNENIAFIPLAFPSVAGPGVISMIISWSSEINNNIIFNNLVNIIFIPCIVFFIINFIVWLSLRFSGIIINFISINGINIISTVMGLILMCIGVQFIINSIFEITF